MGNYYLQDNEIHSWIIDLDSHFKNSIQLKALLSDNESVKAKRFAFEILKQRYIVSHGVLRFLLSKYLGHSSFEIIFGVHGKPYLKESSLYFNLTHSKQYAAVVVANVEVGIDIEYIDDNELLEQIFSEKELGLFKKIPDCSKRSVFYQAWTRKEAYLKNLGIGLSQELSKIEVAFSAPLDWTFIPINFSKDYCGSIAVNMQYPKHILKTFTFDSC